MKKYIFILINSICIAQLNTIEQIVIIGNKTTLDNTILNYINHNVGDTININQAIDEQLNLYETGLFYDVTILPSTKYIIFVSEKPQISPQPRLDNHDILGWSYGASVLFNNIKGENKKLEIGALTGKTTIYDLKYKNPKLLQTNDSLNIHIYKKYFVNIEKDFSLDKIGILTSFNLPTNKTSNLVKLIYKYDYHLIKLLSHSQNERIYSFETILSYIHNKNRSNLQKKNTFKIDYSFITFKNHYENYHKLKIKNNFSIPLIKNKNLGRFVLINQSIINFSNNLPIYNQIYLNTENLIRGYSSNPLNYIGSIYNKLKWNNIIASTAQLELPLFEKKSIKTELLFFIDYGIGSNTYSRWEFNNKLKGFGFGIRYEIIKYGKIDLCFGLNTLGERNFHVITNFKSF